LQLTNGREVVLARPFEKPDEYEIFTKIRIDFGENNTLLVDNVQKTTGHKYSKKPIQLLMEENRSCIIPLKLPGIGCHTPEILLDFDVAKSVRAHNSDYLLRPQIFHIADPFTGISGKLPGSARALVYVTDFNDIHSAYTDMDGSFLIRGIHGGRYTVLARAVHGRNTTPGNRFLWCREVDVYHGEISMLHF
jgi:hypothetical protein